MAEATAHQLLTSGAGTGTWQLDAGTSSVRIANKSMWGLVTVRGTFSGISGEGTIGADGVVAGTLTVDAASVDTKNAKRDKHLRSADFFDVENHPSFVVRVTGGGTEGAGVALEAELTVRGVSEVLPVTAQVDQQGQDMVKVRVETVVERRRFGMTWGQMGMMNASTTVAVEAVFHRA
jgi:polyisoprenoid-binding protein YceI